MTQTTLLLDTVAWDLITDLSGNIPVASDPYSEAQDAASAIRTFQGEVYYNSTLGVPYWALILGMTPPLSLMKAQFVAAALTVPLVSTAICYITGFTNRQVTGQVQITDVNGNTSAASF
jgi:hypothetical protein